MTKTTIDQTKAFAALTLEDLDAALLDERHNGFGYAGKFMLPERTGHILDAAVIRVANSLSLNEEGLFLWANSKYGRWLVDSVQGQMTAAEIGEEVEKHLNSKAMRVLAAGG